MIWRQISFHYYKCLEKKMSIKTFYFLKREMPWCAYRPDGRNKWALRKNVQDTCCIDIRTMADKEEEG